MVWPAAGLALIVVLAALRWLLALLFSTDRSGDLTFPEDRSARRTTLEAGALTEAVMQEIESYRGVHAARARLIGDPDDADLVVTATREETADLAALRQQIESGVLTHAGSCRRRSEERDGFRRGGSCRVAGAAEQVA